MICTRYYAGWDSMIGFMVMFRHGAYVVEKNRNDHHNPPTDDR